MSGPLNQLKIVDLSLGAAGALATMLLGDNGANIIKVEPPGGDPARIVPALRVWNRNKKRICQELKEDIDTIIKTNEFRRKRLRRRSLSNQNNQYQYQYQYSS